MPTRSSKPKDHDFATIARSVVEQTIGEKLDGSPLPDLNAGKNSKLTERARKGGIVGGPARAAKLTDKQRAGIAKVAAAARWKKS